MTDDELAAARALVKRFDLSEWILDDDPVVLTIYRFVHAPETLPCEVLHPRIEVV